MIKNIKIITDILKNRINWDYEQVDGREQTDTKELIDTANLYSLYLNYEDANYYWLKYDRPFNKPAGTHHNRVKYLEKSDILLLDNKYYVGIVTKLNKDELLIKYYTHPNNLTYGEQKKVTVDRVKKINVTEEIKSDIEKSWLKHLTKQFLNLIKIKFNDNELESYHKNNKWYFKIKHPERVINPKLQDYINQYLHNKNLRISRLDNYIYFYKAK